MLATSLCVGAVRGAMKLLVHIFNIVKRYPLNITHNDNFASFIQ